MLGTIKTLLGIAATDNTKDNLLNTLINLNTNKLLSRIGEVSLPLSLEFIIIEMTIERYNRLGSEGLTSESIEGISYTYAEATELLKPYEPYISRYLNAANGKFRFL